MTIEQFLGLSSEEMHKISDEELLNHFGPLLKITRPLENKDYAEQKPTKEKKPRKTKESKEEKINAILAKLENTNEDIKNEAADDEDEDDEEDNQLMLSFFNNN